MELTAIIGISDTAINNNIRYLRINGYIKRIGEKKLILGGFEIIANKAVNKII